MLKLFKNFMKEEEGNVVEYILVLAVIAVVVALAFPQLRNSLTSWFSTMMTKVSTGIGGSTNGYNVNTTGN